MRSRRLGTEGILFSDKQLNKPTATRGWNRGFDFSEIFAGGFKIKQIYESYSKLSTTSISENWIRLAFIVWEI
jgi:hypothetical protein